jgi:hypothetical protein
MMPNASDLGTSVAEKAGKPVADTGRRAKAAQEPKKQPSERLLFEISEGWGIGADDLQWMLMRRHGKEKWKQLSWHRVRSSLMRVIMERRIDVHDAGYAALMALPEKFGAEVATVKDGGLEVSKHETDHGTPELAQHYHLRLEGSGKPHVRVMTQRAVDRYYVDGKLEDARDPDRGYHRWVAGCQFYADFYLSGFEAVARSQLGAATKTSGNDGEVWTDTIVAARQRYNAAMDAVKEELRPVLVAVVCHDKPAPSVVIDGKRVRDWGVVALRDSLDLLMAHYDGRVVRGKRNG